MLRGLIIKFVKLSWRKKIFRWIIDFLEELVKESRKIENLDRIHHMKVVLKTEVVEFEIKRKWENFRTWLHGEINDE